MGLSCTEEGGNGPSLGCTEQGGNGYTKGEEREVIPPLSSLVISVLQEAKGKKRRTFYENLYRERPTNSSEADIKGFMGDTAYDQFNNIFQRKIPVYTQEKLARDLDSEEVLYAIHNGKHGVAPGISGFSREFYQVLGKDLIGFIMKYIAFSEEQGILSGNQRVGVITLLPKGTKDKKTLKNWRPITLLSTLYKIISGVIANRFKTALPYVIGLSQKGYVDGRYMGEVTRLLYDTIHDAYSSKGKKGLIMSID